jgi:signal transduction histidine kinase
MVQSESEREQQAGAIRLLSFGFLAAAVAAEAVFIMVWLFASDLQLVPLSALAVATILTSLVAYWANRSGYTRFAGYFLVCSLIIIFTFSTYLVGGSTGPIAIILALPILTASIVIGIRSTFLVATAVSILFLASLLVEAQHLLPQIILGRWEEIARNSGNELLLLYIGVSIRIISFYVIAFLSWFAASRLSRALQDSRRYVAELQTANEKLQASEEELRASNEELEASNEELRSTEEELRASNEELEAANEEIKEAQEQLVRTEKLAAIGQLAGGVGHELRNPLGAIKNAIYFIKGKISNSELIKKEPRIMEFLDIVDDEINSSNKIINDLLGFSRVGKPAVSPVKIEKVIDEAIAHIPIPESVELIKNLDGSIPEIKVDSDQIRQVFVNIITNAVQAMPEGGRLTVGVRIEDKSLEVEFIDNGTGMPEESIGKIFDPLYTMKARGIGLGLAVCRSIVERHGGRIEVKSQIGQGSTFTVKLPLETA